MKRGRAIGLAGLLLLLVVLILAKSPLRESLPEPPRRPEPAPEAAAPRPPDPKPATAPSAPPPVEEPAKMPETGAIVGVALRLDGTPAAGARVRAAPGGDESKRVVATAGADGTFRFDGLAPGSWSVACGGGGFGTRLDLKAPEPVAEVVAGGEARVEVRAQELATVSGRVTGPDGAPVAGAKVTVQCEAFLSAEGGVWHLKAETGPDGAYEVKNVSPGEGGGVGVEAEGFGAFWKWIHDIAPGARVVVDVALEKAAALDLVLVADDDGMPVTKAYVWIHDAEGDTNYSGPEGGSFPPDEQGRVHAGSLKPRPVKVQIDAPGFVHVMDEVLDPTKLSEPYTFRLARALSISGRLLRADGSPFAGQEVRAIPEGEEEPMSLLHADQVETGPDGSFCFERVRAGRWKVCYGGDHPLRPVASVVVDAGATDVVLRAPVGPVPGGGPRTIRVRFVDRDGKSVPKVRVRSGQMAAGNPCRYGGGGYPQAGIEATIEEHLTPFVEAWDAFDDAGNRLPLGHVFLEVPRDAPEEWTVTLPPENFVEGTVLGPGDRPVEGARIEVVTVPGEGLTAGMSQELGGTNSGAGGAFRVGGLGPADRVLLAPSAEGLIGPPMKAAAGAKGVVLHVVAEAKCVLRVLDHEGKPLEGAIVSAFVPEEGGGDRWRAPSFHTDAEGRVRLRGLEPGHRYRLLVWPQKRPDVREFRSDDWTPEVTEVRLEPAPPREE